MTIRIQLNDGIKTTTMTYRGIIRRKNLAEIVENFYENRNWCKWGTIVQLKGNERLLLHNFGTLDFPDATTLTMKFKKSLDND